MKIGLVDRAFAHSKMGFSSDYCVPRFDIEWDRSCSGDIVVFTDSSIPLAQNEEYKDKKKIAWLIEPRELIGHVYDYVTINSDLFDDVMTHEPDYFKAGQPVILGGCWVWKKDHKIYRKKKAMSIVASGKTHLEGHRMRHGLISKLREEFDVYGREYNPVKHKLETLEDYKFQIVIENVRKDNWFTEKLIDCFVTGTIPIYWGCPNIGEYFDTEGIIQVANMQELEEAVVNHSLGLYDVSHQVLLNNLVKARYYTCAENQIFHRIRKL